MEIWKLLVLFFCAFLGGLSIFLVKNDKSKLLKLILSFSGAYKDLMEEQKSSVRGGQNLGYDQM